MASQKQIDANRRNARFSTGPRTLAGKLTARLNAVQHGLTGQLTIIPRSEYPTYIALDQRMTASLNPIGEQELQLAARLVRDTWRLHRAAANEENLYALDLIQSESPSTGDPSLDVALCNAETFSKRTRDFDRSSLYEQRLNRSLHKNYALFRELQKERNCPPVQYVARTRKLKVHPPAPVVQAPDYDENGFVFADSIATPVYYPPYSQTPAPMPVLHPPTRLDIGLQALCLS